MKLIFVHGWSVTSTSTYGELPEVLQREAISNGLEIEIENIYLGEYISFHDEVILDDIARAFEKARVDKIGNERFACITHSTGGPVIRLWIDLFFKTDLPTCPLSHLVMLAPANHGSSLAILGKSRLGRIKAWWDDVEPGTGVLNWLQLGSADQWNLNHSWINYSYGENTFYPFVLSGEKIDDHFYDFLNPYLVEEGSDGVVRLTGANLNYQLIKLVQNCQAEELDARIDGTTIKAFPLEWDNAILTSPKCAFEVIPSASHSGDRFGIMGSVKKSRAIKPVVPSIFQALKVNSQASYDETVSAMRQRTENVQKSSRYIMFVFNIQDNYGNPVHDFDMLLLAGDNYEPGKLPKGFFIDKQKNSLSGNLVFYINYDKIKNIKDSKLGIRIVARPDEGFSHYAPAEFRMDGLTLESFLNPNQTIMVDVILTRLIAENTFVLDKITEIEPDFKKRKPSNETIDNLKG
ncbi:MAG: hypothetical protein PHI47_10640 [Sulfuricurvum sp.]|uniref:esterase/lipase family protein n=1 Tax=Sulfuricurvum sp. TaxID=2025608 RepID=UPI002631A9A4|nr:hypothetical protein [Sulfuricurvum sp.]MDD5160499.1 hypothetical protein [Sulfuricurvum sp.]